MDNKKRILALAISAAMVSGFSATAAADASQLGNSLTPVGAERAGNGDGSIPAWSGDKAAAPAGFSAGAKPVDAHAGGKPQFSIDAGNVDKYAANLTAGQVELVKSLPGYRMDVYPTSRECPIPASVAEQTKANVGVAKLSDNGYGLASAIGGGFPFATPKKGAEAVWNFKLRHQGEFLKADYVSALPPKGASGKSLGEFQFFDDTFLYPMGKPGATLADTKGVEFYFMDFITAPAAIAGEGVLAHYYLDKANDLWLYFASQRRVRRAPTYQYDAPVTQTDNLLAVDQVWMFNGTMDRYDFKLVGKKEIYIPYNNVAMYDHTVDPADVHDPLFMVRDKVRYERHRVWVVEANVKDGVRHSFPKRVMYLDEDSWLMAAQDLYDAQGKVWRSMEAYTTTDWTLGACVQAGYVSYDLQVGRYISDKIVAGSGKAPQYAKGDAVPMKVSDFKLQSFRQRTGR